VGGLLACSHNEIIIGTLKLVALYVALLFFALLPLKGKKNNLNSKETKKKETFKANNKTNKLGSTKNYFANL
jgi:hypothetical protein